ncbi:hypothetical protein Tco_0679164, partial [Tanacetum coccineum]
RSIDDVSNTMFHANKKPALRSDLTPREQRHYKRDRIREEENKDREPTPREQRLIRRDIVREEENKRFALNGRLIFGPDASLVNFFPDNIGRLLVAFPAVFTFYILALFPELDDDWDATSLSSDWAQSGKYLAPTKSVNVNGTVIVVLIFCVAARDPGIIPRTQPSSDVDDDWDNTYENFRYRYERRKNPFNHGCVHNFKEVLFSKTPRSQNDFRAFVKPEIYSQYDSSK